MTCDCPYTYTHIMSLRSPQSLQGCFPVSPIFNSQTSRLYSPDSYILEDRHNTNPCCHLLKLTHSHPCADCPADTQNKGASWAHRELSAQCRHQSFAIQLFCKNSVSLMLFLPFGYWLKIAWQIEKWTLNTILSQEKYKEGLQEHHDSYQ